MALEIKSSEGLASENQTQSPQTARQTSNGGTDIRSVQPGTNNSLLAQPLPSQAAGIPLKPTPLPGVNLAPASTSVRPATTAPVAKPRDLNPTTFILPALLFVVAIILFWIAGRGDKKYNK